MGLWYLKNLDGRIYIYVGDSRLKATYGTMKEIGCVLDVKSQTAGGCRTYIVVSKHWLKLQYTYLLLTATIHAVQSSARRTTSGTQVFSF